MKLQWIILISTATFALGFIVYLMCRLTQFKGLVSARVTTTATHNPPPAPAPHTSRHRRSGSIVPDGPTDINLRRLLLRLERSTPTGRLLIIENARPRIEEFEPFLIRILEIDTDDLVIPAMRLAVGFQTGHAAREMMHLAYSQSPRVREIAILLRSQLKKWTPADLAHLLDYATTTPVISAILGLVENSDPAQRPVEQLMKLLRDDRPSVRDASSQAFPTKLSSDQLTALCELALAKNVESGVRRSAADALGKTAIGDEAEDCLMCLLDSPRSSVRQAALQALSNKQGSLREPDRLFAVIEDPNRNLHERVHCFIAIEKTGTISIERIKCALPGLHPLLRMLASRCLLLADEGAALEILVDVLDTKTTNGVRRSEASCAVFESRMILQEITGRDLGPDSGPWKQWLAKRRDERTDTPKTTLKRAAPTSW